MPLYVVPRDRPGTLALSPAPRGGHGLDAEVAAFVAAGVTDVVCLLPDAELARLGLAGESEALARNGIAVHRMPVQDFGVPDPAAALALADDVAARLADGANVVVHCRGGVGRSSTVAALVLVREGLAANEAWRVLSAARGRRVPETAAQERFVAGATGSAPGPTPVVRRAVEAAGVVLARGVGSVMDAVRRRG